MQDAAKPVKDPEAVRLEAFKKRVAKSIEEMEKRLATGDFSKKPKISAVELDPEALDLKEKQERLKIKIDLAIKEQKRANMTIGEKTADLIRSWRRFVLLSGARVLVKLGSAASSRFVTTPLESMMGNILELNPLLKKIGAEAHREGGGFVPRQEVVAFRQLWQKESFDDMRNAWNTGLTSLDVLYGDKKYIETPELLNMFGRLHTIIKVMPKRAEFYRSLQQRT